MTIDRTLLQERLVTLIRRFADRKVLVVGDCIADQFVYGGISRVSREAPVFILRHEHTETVPGGAANCATNLASLGAQVSVVGVIGEDEPGQALGESMKAAGIDCSGLLRVPGSHTTRKVRILAGQQHSPRQQVIRIDYDAQPLGDFRLRRQLQEHAERQASAADSVIISDYNYGVANPEIAAAVRETSDSRMIPVLVDSRFKLLDYSELTSATPNEEEVETLLRKEVPEDEFDSACSQLRERLKYRALLVTRGSRGMSLFEDGVPPLHLEAVGAREPVDVTGAGDTVIATYSLALASDGSFPDAARLATHAGGLSVMKRGTASISPKELEQSVLHAEPA